MRPCERHALSESKPCNSSTGGVVVQKRWMCPLCTACISKSDHRKYGGWIGPQVIPGAAAIDELLSPQRKCGINRGTHTSRESPPSLARRLGFESPQRPPPLRLARVSARAVAWLQTTESRQAFNVCCPLRNSPSG